MNQLQAQPKGWQKKPIADKKVRIYNQINIEDYVQNLVAAFQGDFTVQEACDYSGIALRTFYDYLKKDPVFAEKMRIAKEFPKQAAKQKVMKIINSGADREAGPMARWLLEKRQPEIYAPQQKLDPDKPNNTQNNYFILNNDQLSNLTKQSDISNASPSELLEALEEKPQLDNGAEEGSTLDLH